jgi:hypothetical protein
LTMEIKKLRTEVRRKTKRSGAILYVISFRD